MEDIELFDCPQCQGVGMMEEEAGWCVYVACIDCGCHTVEVPYNSEEEKLEAYRQNEKANRCEYVHWDLLRWHTDWVKLCGELLCCACVGNAEGADAAFAKIPVVMRELVHLRPDIYDHELCCTAVNQWRR